MVDFQRGRYSCVQGANGNLGEGRGVHPTEALESGNRNQADMLRIGCSLQCGEFWSHELLSMEHKEKLCAIIPR